MDFDIFFFRYLFNVLLTSPVCVEDDPDEEEQQGSPEDFDQHLVSGSSPPLHPTEGVVHRRAHDKHKPVSVG